MEGADGTLRVYTLDHDELVQIAQSRVSRAFTEDECATYHIDPCPTVDDMKTGSAYRHICATWDTKRDRPY